MEQFVKFFFKFRSTLFEKSEFGFGVRPTWLVLLGVALLVALFVYFIYSARAARLTPGWRAALITIRCLLLALLLICLMRPVIVVPEVVPQSTYVAVLMDDSASMQLPGSGGMRLDEIRGLMSQGRPFHAALSEKFKVNVYRFSNSVERVGDASALEGRGERTGLAAALEQAVRDGAGLPMSGIIVMSDGAGNGNRDSEDGMAAALDALRARGVPVFTIGIGEQELEGDVELLRATAPRRALAGSPVTAELLVRASGDQRSIRIDIHEDERPMRSQDVPVQGGATSIARVTFTPTTPGLHRYRFSAVSNEDDPVADNNWQEIVLEVEDARRRILYIEGEPRWEYGKLRTALVDEKNIVIASVLRSADGKFYRQGIEHPDELVSGFPKSIEELFKYDAVMIGSIEATFFTFDQLKMIEEFVARRGGTLLLLGGKHAFNAGGYQNTPIADLSPVYLRGNAPAGETQTFKAAPSERGRDNPVARLTDKAEAKDWDALPPITLPEIIEEIKPGATVVLEARDVRDRSRAAPLLVEERYGRGRTLALLASDTWRWRMMLESKNKSFESFWKNLSRYLVENIRRPVEAASERGFYEAGEPVRLRVEVADERYLNVRDARLSARVTTPTGRTLDIAMQPVVEGGFEGYAGEYVPDEDGVHRVEVTAQTKSGSASLGQSATSFVVGPLNREARNAALNRELLTRLAADTGGRYYGIDQANNLIEDLSHTESENSVRVTYDLWDMPFNFLLLVALAVGEWFIRKRKGLA